MYLIYLTHFFGWWTVLLFLGTARKQFIFNVGNSVSIAAGSAVYAIPSSGFHYFVRQLLT